MTEKQSDKVKINFFLKGIDARALIDKYNAGAFSKCDKLPESKVKTAEYKDALIATYSSNTSQETFSRQDSAGNSYIFDTTNNAMVKDCHWCREKIEGDPISLPIILLCKEDKKYHFYCDGLFDTFNCAYAHYLHYSSDALYCNSEVYLKHIHNMLYPNVTLHAAPDWRLLQRNGGSLTKKEFDKKDSSKFIRIPNVVLSASRVEYLRQ